MNCFSIRRRLIVILALATFAGAAPAFAQQRDTTAQRRDTTAQTRATAAKRDTTVADTTPKHITARTAFFRSVLLPGWGQFSVGANRRAVAFITLQSTSWYMLVKTLNKVSAAHKRVDEVRGFAKDSLLMDTTTAAKTRYANADSLKLAIDTFSLVKDKQKLLHSRQEQRQDWITYTLFLTLASGVDAFVAAQLADFPANISTRREPNGAYQLKVTVPFPRRQ
jgi:hypothetical protein